MDVIIPIILIACGYLYGSIPFALVIGKVFYKTDVRNYGSGNLGGTNTGRVLGKKAGVAVILLDASKALLVSLLTNYLCHIFNLNSDLHYVCALACVIGHCYPIFANFKGGKAVSTAIGFFFTINPLGAVLALVVFFIVLKISKYVSLSSVIASGSVLLATPFMDISLIGKICVAAVILLLIYRHRANLKRVKEGTESKITWM
ncbi:glycerol-3-phosphate 1-O-acyltransferase PlsY [uncultured Thomasclavelia sp.]|uniref:glycerol-3-phosphate 1-O-acyltransferase PlsY n=1 Tax=uncultured Thomasclavelia sp. TaxID=3025759 RepID=UPI0025CF586F|nr:glycerol-3-phosphate 1-O-acyltransferase PlsY [uncultured Thomasclavelia sp.]